MKKSCLMEFTKYIAPDGAEYSFDVDDRFLISEDGLGMPPIEYITQKGAYEHGETLIDFRLLPRIIQMQVRQDSCSRYTYWEKRALLLNMIRPNRFVSFFDAGVLRKELPNGEIRDLRVVIDQGPGFVARANGRWDEWGFTETLRFIAYNPFFFNPVKRSITIDPFSIPFEPIEDSQWQLPWEFPMWFGETAYFFDTVSYPALTFTYPGTWVEFPKIIIVGPANGLTITNVTTGEFLKFNYAIPAGDTVTITLDIGNKTVTDNHGVNLAGTLSSDSDFTEFHIASEPEAPLGVNIFTIAVSGTTEDSKFTMEYYERYIGI